MNYCAVVGIINKTYTHFKFFIDEVNIGFTNGVRLLKVSLGWLKCQDFTFLMASLDT
jgi:hypothetical protein